MDLGNRIFQLLKSVSADQIDQFDKMLRDSKEQIYSELEKWEKKHGINPEEPWQHESQEQSTKKGQEGGNRQQESQHKTHYKQQHTAYSDSFLKDLATFDLKPPTNLEAVKKARNREIKKYHPDKFANDPAKQETAKEILQLINGAFARLEKHPLLK